MKRVNLHEALHEAYKWSREENEVTYTTIGEANLIFSGLIFQELLEGENGIDKYYDAFIVKHHAQTLDDLYRIANQHLSMDNTDGIEVKFWYDIEQDRYLVEEV